MNTSILRLAILAILTGLLIYPSFGGAEEITLSLRSQTETAKGTGRFHQLEKLAKWKADETAVIVCDVWDLHHSLNAVRRVEEIGPRLNAFVKDARNRGMTIIHAPSDCMKAYEEHPARIRAKAAPKSENLPADIKSWCSKLPVEEQAVYPLDQSDGGDDDDPKEHLAWAKKLKAMGRNPGTPWQKQSDLIEIDAEQDFISDQGDEVWNVLAQRGIKNVILTGVHTNMCVLGRPFGLRQLARNGKQVVLVRDLTDTMYNPKRWPYVSHFTGTDLIVSHIERWICPSITSDQLLDGKPLRFKNDKRPHLVMLIAEDEYETDRTLPEFASNYLGKEFRVSMVFDREENIHDMPGLEVLDDADALLISVRRRPLPAEQLQRIKTFVAEGKPVIGIRTASHAFSTRKGVESAELKQWPELDAEVFGGNYHNHHGNGLKCTVKKVAAAGENEILTGIADKPFTVGGSLYQTSPLAKGATPLLMGSVPGKAAEPVAWTFKRADGGRSFYTSLGHKDDFENPAFIHLLYNGICWATDVPIRSQLARSAQALPGYHHWSLHTLPGPLPKNIRKSQESAIVHLGKLTSVTTASIRAMPESVMWYRCGLRITDDWQREDELQLEIPSQADAVAEITAWLNGEQLEAITDSKPLTLVLPRESIERNDVNLLVIRFLPGKINSRTIDSMKPPTVTAGKRKFKLQGQWQSRCGTSKDWHGIPLPARYGIGADIIFEPGLDASH